MLPFRRDLRSSQPATNDTTTTADDSHATRGVAAIDIQRWFVFFFFLSYSGGKVSIKFVFLSYEMFKKRIRQTFDAKRAEQLPLKDVIDEIQLDVTSSRKFTKSEIDAALERMADENRAMVTEGVMYLIWVTFILLLGSKCVYVYF